MLLVDALVGIHRCALPFLDAGVVLDQRVAAVERFERVLLM